MTDPSPLVLLVEDDENLCAVITRFLRSRGYRDGGRAVCGGGRASSCAAAFDRDSSCSTSTCPVTPAGTSCAATRSPRPGSPPVVITSATVVSPKRLTEFGVAGYLPKPFPLETLVSTVERFTGSEATTPAHD